MSIILWFIRIHFEIIYFFIKLLTHQKSQVFLLSRQFSSPSINYQRIMDELDKKKIPYKVICKKVSASLNDSVRTQGNYSNTSGFIGKLINNLKSSLSYYFSLYKQMVYIAQSKVIIVDGYNLPVSLLKHKKGTKVIQMWHALGAIKKFGYQSIGKVDGINPKVAKILKMHYGYDYVISGSVGMVPYFAEAFGVDRDKVLPIGTPLVDYLKEDREDEIKKIYKRYPELKKKINVLYSPTFRNDKEYKFDEIINNTDFSKVNLIVTQHSKVEKQEFDSKVIAINSEEFSTFDVLKVCDYVITDYSALMIDACIVGKKILLYTYDYDKYNKNNGINIDFRKNYSSLNYEDAKELMDIINNDKYDMNEYKDFKKKYTPQIKKTSTQEIMNIIYKCLDNGGLR